MFDNTIIKRIILAIGLVVVLLVFYFNRHELGGFSFRQKQDVPSTKATCAMDSLKDSLQQQDLYRKQQAVVNIDMEEHTEPVYFTIEDIKAYGGVVQSTFEKIKK